MNSFTEQGKVLDQLPAIALRNSNPDDPDHAANRLAADERAYGVSTALKLIVNGHQGKALWELVRSVERQYRILGGGTVQVPPTCPCGRCERAAVGR